MNSQVNCQIENHKKNTPVYPVLALCNCNSSKQFHKYSNRIDSNTKLEIQSFDQGIVQNYWC